MMPRLSNSTRTLLSKMAVITALGAGIGIAIGSAVGNPPLGLVGGTLLGAAGGAVFEFLQRRKRAG